MEEIVQIIRIGRSAVPAIDNSKYLFQFKDGDNNILCQSDLSLEENERIFNAVDKIAAPKNFEPGSFKLLCKIQFDRSETSRYINPIIKEFISLEKL